LDGNEGGARSPALLARLALEDPSVLRDYPDPRGLEGDIARSLGVDPKQVVVTAGADDALDRVCRAYLRPGRKAVLPIPTFEMMYRYIAATGGGVETVPWADDFPTDEVIEALAGEVSLVVMISPNNPTGRVVTAEDLTRVAEAASRAVVLLDHAYVDYADEDLTLVAAQFENVVTVRTFSKAWGLAGCRVGYAVASPEVAMVLRNTGNPFPVAGLSIAAVREQLLGNRTPMEEHVKRNREGRALLMEGLASFGAEPLPSQGNFVFTDFGDRATFIQDGLASLGIRVRRFSHRREISTGLRITVPELGEELERVLAALASVMAPEALLFDLDGVLANVEGSYRRCVLETVASFGVPITREELEGAVLAGQANNDWILAQRILAERGVDVSLENVTQRFQELYLGTAEAPGLRESESLLVERGLLERLAGRLPLGIVTGRPRGEATWFLEKMGISDLFGTVVCMEDGPLKPDPEPVRMALSGLGILRAWMVGDTPDDIRSSVAAGVVPLGIVAPGDDPTKAGPSLRDAGAAVVLDDLTNLEELLP
ncbi:MAG: aminotransferase class I/II-fold pyridoxal phosphate-dependent enzyme, partial [Gemmatimonadota bacterium]